MVLADIHSLMFFMIALLIYAIVFAANSAMHSYLIVAYANQDGVSLDVGFYYMANAAGRLVGTVLSGWVFQVYGLGQCLLVSAVMVVLASMMTKMLQGVETS
jgi:predicted MFS family arabinose efflux permease